MRRNPDKELILCLFLEFEPSEQQGKSGKRPNAAPRTLGDLLTLDDCQDEQDSMTFFRQNFDRLGSKGTTSFAQDKRGLPDSALCSLTNKASYFGSWPNTCLEWIEGEART